MNIAAYCRVSTEKEDQLNSLEAQKRFFLDYTARTGNSLVRLYADEGISGTKIKNRKQFLQMMRDAESGVFDMLVVKDISRFARNTVDLLENIRKLKSYGIETQFLTANMTSMGNSEFVLTMFAALAQEESANTSKRVKFGKKINAEKGRVPNLVYGYDKTAGDYFSLAVNGEEARNIRRIYDWYINGGCGAGKIAAMLNGMSFKTKRGCKWTQNAVCRILSNEIYTGKIINGKQEVADFLTGRRADRPPEEWLIKDCPELRIIDDDTFVSAQRIMRERGLRFRTDRQRHSNRYLFSTLIKCGECSRSFRRVVRRYKNTYVRWVCSDRNGKGIESCSNAVSVDENELIEAIEDYFAGILLQGKNAAEKIIFGLERGYRSENGGERREKELQSELNRINRNRQKFIDMFTDDLITREELSRKIGGYKAEAERLGRELELVRERITSPERLREIISAALGGIRGAVDLRAAGNERLRGIIDRIEVNSDGSAAVFLKPLKTAG